MDLETKQITAYTHVKKQHGESAKSMEPRGVVEGFTWMRDECGTVIGENIHDQSTAVSKACDGWVNIDGSQMIDVYDLWHSGRSLIKIIKEILE